MLRIEAPGHPYLERSMTPQIGADSATHAILHRGKSSFALDLKRPESIAIVRRLLRSGRIRRTASWTI
ncbi:MAG: CoA transferase [Rudaea sp.]|uniref:CoA transferase n=1 Tax=Rudaea sp. TaxID=2136325 RepID=UPI0039E387DD